MGTDYLLIQGCAPREAYRKLLENDDEAYIPGPEERMDPATLADFSMVWYEITGIIINYICGFWMGIMVVFATFAFREGWRRYNKWKEAKQNERSNECSVRGVDCGNGRDEQQSEQ